MITVEATKELSSWYIQYLLNDVLKASLLQNTVLIGMDDCNQEGINEFRAWCQNNLRGHWYMEQVSFASSAFGLSTDTEPRQFTMSFELEEDSLAFKLQWAG